MTDHVDSQQPGAVGVAEGSRPARDPRLSTVPERGLGFGVMTQVDSEVAAAPAPVIKLTESLAPAEPIEVPSMPEGYDPNNAQKVAYRLGQRASEGLTNVDPAPAAPQSNVTITEQGMGITPRSNVAPVAPVQVSAPPKARGLGVIFGFLRRK